MKTKITVEELLRWRAEQSTADAPPAPRASRLLELARPWWEIWPEKFHAITQQLGAVQMRYGHAMVEPTLPPAGRPVPAVMVDAENKREMAVHILYLEIEESILHLRFEIDAAPGPLATKLDCIFLSEATLEPLFSAAGQAGIDREYFVDTWIPDSVVQAWRNLKVTDGMPFRLILLLDSQPD